MIRHAVLLLALAIALCGEAFASAAESAAPKSISLEPAEATLRGSRATQQLLVTGLFQRDREGDLTRDAKFESLVPTIAVVSASGLVTPVADGVAHITVRMGSLEATSRILVSGMGTPSAVDFRTDVMAALSRAGCSQGACHGSPQGKGGFRLSLRGYDPNLDLDTLTRETAGRRTNRLDPAQSLLLLKGAARVPHQGGQRFQLTDPAYQTLLGWIGGGCLDSAVPRPLKKLEVLPAKRSLDPAHPTQQLVALAHFADGSVVDVTSLAVFTTGHDAAVSVSPQGLVKFNNTHEASVLVRYLEQVRSVQLTYIRDDPNYAFQGPEPANLVDRHIFARQRAMQLQPSGLSSDSAFLRRVYLDTIGALPTPDEAKAFLDSVEPDKRAKLIDQLLQRSEYASFWAMKWADVMRGNRNTVSSRGVHSLHRYLLKHFAEDRPFDQFAREIVTGLGNTLHKPPANFYRIAPSPDDAAESFAQLFLGVRMQCAKCHNHPFEALTQTDYYGLAAYFARVKIKGKQFGLDDEIVYLDKQGEVQHPLTRKNLEPIVFGEAAGKFEADEDRRGRLADWLTRPDNKMFARSTVNRVWYHLLGKGIVEPVDDFRDTNPPSHPELLDELAQEFIKGGYRLRPVLRTILNSKTYQLSAEPVAQSLAAANPARYFTRASVRMLSAEQAVDAVSAAIGLPDRFPGYPLGTRAIELAEGAIDHNFLTAFSKPVRDAACDCAREDEPSLNEVLHLINNRDLVKRIESADSRLGRWLKDDRSTPEIVEGLYLGAVSRRPTDAERKLIDGHIAELGDRAAALRDVQHALLNANEFLLRH